MLKVAFTVGALYVYKGRLIGFGRTGGELVQFHLWKPHKDHD